MARATTYGEYTRAYRQGEPHCTDLLDDPAAVLGDVRRWPTLLCYKWFLLESTYKWARQATPVLTSTASDWRNEYPLPIGKEAISQTLAYLPEVYNAAPLAGDEKALWALHIARGEDTLNLFGLARYAPDDPEQKGTISAGPLAFVLRGHGTSLVEEMQQAKRWWNQFVGFPLGRGRPLNTGTWSSRDEFEQAVKTAVTNLRERGMKVTQEAAAESFLCDDRQIRRWVRQYGLSWEDLNNA
jgi:hypothetical protein